jgi:hypothetical protein
MMEWTILKDMTPGAYGIWLLVVMAATTAIRGWPALKKLQVEADGSLRTDLLRRIDGLETQIDVLRAESNAHHERCDKIIAEIRGQHALEMHKLREQHLVELARALAEKTDGGRS